MHSRGPEICVSLVHPLEWPESYFSSYSPGSDLDLVPRALHAIAVPPSYLFGVPHELLVHLPHGVPALVPAAFLLPHDEPVMSLSLFAPPQSGTSWDRIRSMVSRFLQML